MISWVGAVLLVVGFVVLIRLCGLVEKSGDVVTIARRSFGVIRSAALSDEAKEVALQKDAKQLWRLFLELAFGGAVAVLLPAGLLWVCDRLGWLSLASVFSVSVSPVFLITSGVFAVLACRTPRSKTPDRTDYSALDRSEGGSLHLRYFERNSGRVEQPCRKLRPDLIGDDNHLHWFGVVGSSVPIRDYVTRFCW
jgi:hypothetical protein